MDVLVDGRGPSDNAYLNNNITKVFTWGEAEKG